jgi:hypothetical protein
MTQDTKRPCGVSSFNFCFWAKLLVAIPAIPIIALAAASLSSYPVLQAILAGGAVFCMVWLAVVIDRLPIFSSMIIKRNRQ